jgi:hypothetical protein
MSLVALVAQTPGGRERDALLVHLPRVRVLEEADAQPVPAQHAAALLLAGRVVDGVVLAGVRLVAVAALEDADVVQPDLARAVVRVARRAHGTSGRDGLRRSLGVGEAAEVVGTRVHRVLAEVHERTQRLEPVVAAPLVEVGLGRETLALEESDRVVVDGVVGGRPRRLRKKNNLVRVGGGQQSSAGQSGSHGKRHDRRSHRRSESWAFGVDGERRSENGRLDNLVRWLGWTIAAPVGLGEARFGDAPLRFLGILGCENLYGGCD